MSVSPWWSASGVRSPSTVLPLPVRLLHTSHVREVVLTEAEKADAAAQLKDVPNPYLQTAAHLHVSARLIAHALPHRVIAMVRAMVMDPKATAALLIRGLPMDPVLPPTPSDGGRVSGKKTFVSEVLLSGLAQLLGPIFAYSSLKRGELINNIVPVQESLGTQSNEGAEDFHLHVEYAAAEIRPDFLFLLCLKADHDAMALTHVADARAALRQMAADKIDLLRQPVFIVPNPVAHRKAQGGIRWSAPRPLIAGPVECPELLLRMPDTQVVAEESKAAFKEFTELLTSPEVVNSVLLKPGDLLIVDNRKAAHGRSKFYPRFDGQDRWLQRVYVSLNLWAARHYVTAAPQVFDIPGPSKRHPHDTV